MQNHALPVLRGISLILMEHVVGETLNIDPLPYGCAEYKNRECIHCVEHFILDHSTKKCEGTRRI